MEPLAGGASDMDYLADYPLGHDIRIAAAGEKISALIRIGPHWKPVMAANRSICSAGFRIGLRLSVKTCVSIRVAVLIGR